MVKNPQQGGDLTRCMDEQGCATGTRATMLSSFATKAAVGTRDCQTLRHMNEFFRQEMGHDPVRQHSALVVRQFGMAGVTPSPPSGRGASEASLWYFRVRDRAEELFSKRELQRQQRPHGAHHLVAGTTAGLVTTAALYPLDLVKTRYQVREGQRESNWCS